MGVQKHKSKKPEISTGSGSMNTDFLGSNRQFDSLEISLVYDKATNIQQSMTDTLLN